jgi:hypothetical protein
MDPAAYLNGFLMGMLTTFLFLLAIANYKNGE